MSISIWKVSHGSTVISKEEHEECLKKKKRIWVHSKTEKSQGKNFMDSARKGDFFYLTRSNSGIELFGRI